jgi:hypothetical protein
VAEPQHAALVLAVLTPEEGIPTEKKLRRAHGGNDPINNWGFPVSYRVKVIIGIRRGWLVFEY